MPIEKTWIATGANGETYIVEVLIEQTNDENKYPPEGVKSVFKVFKLNDEDEKEFVILIDNHEPFGFHDHTGLPQREPRKKIYVNSWQEAWKVFERKLKEIIP